LALSPYERRCLVTKQDAVRIVVTGIGVVGPLGCGAEVAWPRLLAGQSGIRALPAHLAEGTGTAVGGRVPSLEDDEHAGYEPERFIPQKERKKMDRFIEFALVAAQEALVQAAWQPADEASRRRTATIIASGVGGFGAIAEAVRTTHERGPHRLSPALAICSGLLAASKPSSPSWPFATRSSPLRSTC
jgi:3-oxoacyl-[acyl-carrier-protein] synthase II